MMDGPIHHPLAEGFLSQAAYTWPLGPYRGPDAPLLGNTSDKRFDLRHHAYVSMKKGGQVSKGSA